MRDFDDLLNPESVIFGAKANNKVELFRLVARHASGLAGKDTAILEAQLHEREQAGTTGFGGGIAIPHCQIAGLERPFGVFVKMMKAIDYNSVDVFPVDCVFALFSPTADGTDHLQALAHISRRFRDASFVSKLRGARSADALYALMSSFKVADAA